MLTSLCIYRMLLPVNAHVLPTFLVSPFTLGWLLYPSLDARNLEPERVCQVWGSRQILLNSIQSWLLEQYNHLCSNPKLVTCQPQSGSMHTQTKCFCSVSPESEHKEIQYNNSPLLIHSFRTGSSQPMSSSSATFGPALHPFPLALDFMSDWMQSHADMTLSQT